MKFIVMFIGVCGLGYIFGIVALCFIAQICFPPPEARIEVDLSHRRHKKVAYDTDIHSEDDSERP